jgi:hypothetical protein
MYKNQHKLNYQLKFKNVNHKTATGKPYSIGISNDFLHITLKAQTIKQK